MISQYVLQTLNPISHEIDIIDSNLYGGDENIRGLVKGTFNLLIGSRMPNTFVMT